MPSSPNNRSRLPSRPASRWARTGARAGIGGSFRIGATLKAARPNGKAAQIDQRRLLPARRPACRKAKKSRRGGGGYHGGATQNAATRRGGMRLPQVSGLGGG